MMISMDFKLKGFNVDLLDIGERKALLRIIALNVIKTINLRVYRGKSLEKGKFKRYTEAYRKWKESKGRSPHTDGDWLVFTGQMLAALNIAELTSSHFLVGFQGMRLDGKSNALVAWANQQKRPFVGLSNKEKKNILQSSLKTAEDQGIFT